jgi:hypothetical protein
MPVMPLSMFATRQSVRLTRDSCSASTKGPRTAACDRFTRWTSQLNLPPLKSNASLRFQFDLQADVPVRESGGASRRVRRTSRDRRERCHRDRRVLDPHHAGRAVDPRGVKDAGGVGHQPLRVAAARKARRDRQRREPLPIDARLALALRVIANPASQEPSTNGRKRHMAGTVMREAGVAYQIQAVAADRPIAAPGSQIVACGRPLLGIPFQRHRCESRYACAHRIGLDRPRCSQRHARHPSTSRIQPARRPASHGSLPLPVSPR